MSLITAVQTGLVFGGILSVALAIIIGVTLRINPEMWLQDYPAEVKAVYGPPRRPETKRQQRVAAIIMFGSIFVALVGAVLRLNALGDAGFWVITAAFLTMMMTFNLIDLVLIDWLWMETIKPKFVMLPGTEALLEKRYYGFHFVGFLKGTAGILIASPLLALIGWGALALAA